MAAAVQVRGDYEAAQIRVLAKRSMNAAQTRRLLALAAIYDGGSRTEAARIGGVGLQTVRDWVLAFNAEGMAALVELGGSRGCGIGETQPTICERNRGYDLAWRDDKTLALSGLQMPALSLGAAARAATLRVVDRAW